MLAGLFRCLDHLPRVEAFIEDTLGDEFCKPSEVDTMRWHAHHDLWLAWRRVPIRPHMTGRAIQRDAVKAEAVAPRGADRAVHSLLIDEPQRLPTLAGQVIPAQHGHCFEDPDRQSCEQIAAGRPVFK